MARRRPRPSGSSSRPREGHSTQELSLYIAEDWPPPASVHWLRRKGDKVRDGTEVAEVTLSGPHPVKRVVAPCHGVLEEVLIPEGPVPPALQLTPSHLKLAILSYCTHPYVLHDLCSGCGEKVKHALPPDRPLASAASSKPAGATHASTPSSTGDGATTTSITTHKLHRVFVPGGRHISINQTVATSLHENMSASLRKMRKLNLILDIDHTMLHATIDPRLEMTADQEDMHWFKVNTGIMALPHWCRLRPGLKSFLQEADKLYVLTIYTHGRRDYAEQVARLLDPTKVFFGTRIVSRDDTPDLEARSKSLQRLFPGGIETALIVDDTAGVWQGEQSRHLLPVVPFYFFSDANEVNRPGQFAGPARIRASAEDDEQLAHTLRIIREVHNLYYQELDEEEKRKAASQGGEDERQANEGEDDEEEDFLHSNVKNVADCLARVRARVLRGCSIVFSGVIPRGLGIDARGSDYGQMAETLGAVVTDGLTELTTHLVAENQSTEKVYFASRRPDIAIVTLRWLQMSYYHCQRKKEDDYLLLKQVQPVEEEQPGSKKLKVSHDAEEEGGEISRSRDQGQEENGEGKGSGGGGGGGDAKTGQDEDGEGKGIGGGGGEEEDKSQGEVHENGK